MTMGVGWRGQGLQNLVTEYERWGERLKMTFCFLFEKLWGWKLVLLVNLGGRRVFVVLF